MGDQVVRVQEAHGRRRVEADLRCVLCCMRLVARWLLVAHPHGARVCCNILCEVSRNALAGMHRLVFCVSYKRRLVAHCTRGAARYARKDRYQPPAQHASMCTAVACCTRHALHARRASAHAATTLTRSMPSRCIGVHVCLVCIAQCCTPSRARPDGPTSSHAARIVARSDAECARSKCRRFRADMNSCNCKPALRLVTNEYHAVTFMPPVVKPKAPT